MAGIMYRACVVLLWQVGYEIWSIGIIRMRLMAAKPISWMQRFSNTKIKISDVTRAKVYLYDVDN